ncbi:MAG: sialidase family protein [Candidatus Latescibacterota bacterium]|nr:sialidase family protein [Candidatus Latescibacterota bacterium]MEE2727829.1 sialidase family protein [Candidatus Latescibacterota bacterium]
MRAKVISNEVFVPSPGRGVGVMGGSYYTTRDGLELVSIHSLTSRSDTTEMAYVRRSLNNGQTWDEPQAWPMRFEAEGGTGRRHVRGGYVDPLTGRYIQVWTEGVLPTDEPLEGMRQWKLHYAVSEDGGHTHIVNEQIVCAGDAYDAQHPLPGVYIGQNCVMIGDLGEVPLTRSDGAILVPVQSSPLDENGAYYNPGAGFTYTDCLLLIGRWQSDGHLAWSCSERVCGDPERTTRGLIEPTIAELDDGRLLMVMRGSNDARPAWPGHKWMALSADGGQTWDAPRPWTYTDGQAPFSPSACSQLVPWSDGRLLWLGNICDNNPQGNRPRYPLVLAEVDRQSALLLRDSLQPIDTRGEGEHEMLTLSNFYARADRQTGELLVFLPRFFAQTFDEADRWTTDLSLIRVGIDPI